MHPRLRRDRNAFLIFLAAMLWALLVALPLVNATAAGEPRAPAFEQVDRNKDGSIDKSEAAVVPGLSANFEKADRDKDGKLDKVEFARGLEIVGAASAGATK